MNAPSLSDAFYRVPEYKPSLKLKKLSRKRVETLKNML